MEIRNCKECGRIYNYVSGANLCPRCIKKMDEKFQEVKAYIYDNPGVGINEVSEIMEVSVAQLRRWIKEERLEFAEGSGAGIECEKCGTMIRSGRFCSKCKENLVNTLGNVYQKEEEKPKVETKDSAKMRFF